MELMNLIKVTGQHFLQFLEHGYKKTMEDGGIVTMMVHILATVGKKYMASGITLMPKVGW